MRETGTRRSSPFRLQLWWQMVTATPPSQQSIRSCSPMRFPNAGSHCIRTPATAFSSSTERKSVVEGKSVSVRVDLGGRRIIKKNITNLSTEILCLLENPTYKNHALYKNLIQ